MPEVTLEGRIRAGMVSGSGGRFTLTVRPGSLVVHCFKTWELRADQIVRLQPDGPRWMSRGVKIIHTHPDAPRSLYFSCSGGLARIEQALAEAGFHATGIVEDPRRIKPWQLWLAVLVVLALLPLLVGPHP